MSTLESARMDRNDNSHLDALLKHIREQRGIDFSAYKAQGIKRRLAKRMQTVGAADYRAYIDYLQASPDEFTPLIDTLLINVTQFFRDPQSWSTLNDIAIPRLAERAAGGHGIRVWCAGVASGEEAYTVAMLLAETLGMEAFREHVKVYATDLDDAALAQARSAVYTATQVESLPEPLRSRYFEESGEHRVIHGTLRRAMIFGRHNLLEDAPISRLDLLVCRNTLIYFSREAQSRILARLHFALRENAFLFLGRSETLLTRRNVFKPADAKARIFVKSSTFSLQDRLEMLGDALPPRHTEDPIARAQTGLRELAFDYSPVPQVIVGSGGDLVLANEAARIQFGIGIADLGRPLYEHELSYRPLELRSLIERAFAEKQPVVVRNVECPLPGDRTAYMEVRIVAIKEMGEPRAAAISFADVTRDRELAMELEHSRRELEAAYELLQSTNEELETTNEELQSTVEELETTNEELQSTNEELETMNEELQSSNEETQTVNEELRERTGHVSRLNAYMRSILGSLRPGMVVLDRDRNVHMWNAQAVEQWGVREEEAAGTPFLRLDIGLPVSNLEATIRRCLDGEADSETVLVSGHDRRGREVEYRVTCSPLLGADQSINGVILLIEDRRAEEDAASGLHPDG
jgi:two-component system, chemotaxis family, CheB/CheR fusion protein